MALCRRVHANVGSSNDWHRTASSPKLPTAKRADRLLLADNSLGELDKNGLLGRPFLVASFENVGGDTAGRLRFHILKSQLLPTKIPLIASTYTDADSL